MIRPVQVSIGSMVLAGLAMLLIPVPKPSPDFGRTDGLEQASSASGRADIAATLRDMLRQRVYGLALGWEDPNDHGALRQDMPLEFDTSTPGQ